MDSRIVSFPAIREKGGCLVPLESGRQVPFEIRRVFYLYGLEPGARRGLHAHTQVSEIVICLQGGCCVRLHDGRVQSEVSLHRPEEGLYIGPWMWTEFHDFTPDCMLLVLCDRPFDRADYISDFEEFCRRRREMP